MNSLSRRSFLSLGARFAAAMGLAASAVPALADALAKIARGQAPVLWLQGQSCSGCSISLLNSDPLGADTLLTKYLSLCFHQMLAAATGHVAVQAVEKAIAMGDFVLVVEGAVPVGMPRACVFGEEPFADQLTRAAKRAKAVVTVGTCSSFGGIPAAEHNPTGATDVPGFLKKQGVTAPLVRIPGCPAHPDWTVGTLAHLLAFGVPPLDAQQRPLAFYARVVHEQCPRFADYERENFAAAFGEPGCLFKLGCVGPRTHADCPVRLWNSRTNFCINAGAPCIGCAGADFARRSGFSMYLASNLKSAKATS